MMVALVTGLLGITTLLVKAAVEAGRKESRERSAIYADLELFKHVPEDFAGAELLRQRLERRLADFAGAPPNLQEERVSDQHLQAVERRAAKEQLRMFALLMGAVGALVATTAAVIELQAGHPTWSGLSMLVPVVAVALGGLLGMVQTRPAAGRRRSSLGGSDDVR